MSLWKIALRNVQHRMFPSFLTMLSMALGVMLVVVVLSVHGVLDESFKSNASLGYNMVIGANKGGKLQLTLNTVYYLSAPVENVSYEFYLEFLLAEQRDAELQTALRTQAHKTQKDSAETSSLGPIAGGMGPAGILTHSITQLALERAAAKQLDQGRDGKFSQYVQFVIPVCLGDYLGNFRVVGTTPDFFELLRYGEDSDRRYEFAAGRNFKVQSDENGYFEAVLGSTVARELNLHVGDEIAPAHGSVDGHQHAQTFTVVGILQPTGSPNDRAAFINMEGFYLMDDHAGTLTTDVGSAEDSESRSNESPGMADDKPAADNQAAAVLALSRADARRIPLPVEQREVTAILVLTKRTGALGLNHVINKGNLAQALFPVQQIYALFELFVKPMQLALLGLAILICVVSGTNIVVGIYNSMNERRREIAVIRALGAGRSTVMTIILFESILLSLGGGVLGWTLGHTVNVMISPQIEARTGVKIGFFDLAPGPKLVDLLDKDSTTGLLQWRISPEVVVLPAVILLAIGAGFLPALTAYRTDVSRSLS